MSSFRNFVEQMQIAVALNEASGDRARKLARIKQDISTLERRIDNMEQSHDRYHVSGTASHDKAELSKLRAQLRRYQPVKAPSAKQKRNDAFDNKARAEKAKKDRTQQAAKDKTDKETKQKHHDIAMKHAEDHANKHHNVPARKENENIFDYLDRTKEHTSKRFDAKMKKYYEVKKQLEDGKDV